MTENRMKEIRDIIAGDSLNANGEVMRYVLSTSERSCKPRTTGSLFCSPPW